MKTPCEIIVWQILPVIRREIAKSLIKNYGLTQREVAKKLGITEAAVSRYVSGKRGKIEITDSEFLNEIKKSSSRIIKKDGTEIVKEICRLCNILKSKKIIDGIGYVCRY
jgi:hypothetical protein